MSKLFGVISAAAVVVGSSSPAAASTVISFGTPSGNLGASHTYTSGGFTVIASGFNASKKPTSLFGKNGGGDEIGLGLTNDPSGDNEIYFGKGFVQIDISALLGKVSSISFFTNSTTQGEKWSVFGSNSSGSYSGSALLSGTNESDAILPGLGSWKYYDFSSTSQSGGKNFLLGGIKVNSAVPEPTTWAMLLVGFGMIGGASRYRRRKINISLV